MQDNICVSIICNTYNHEKYIAHALESFLMQKTDFSFEILVHDDASTDSTPDIIKTYAEKYPDIIKPILQTENQFSKGINVTQVFQYSRAKGKYIAFCEGDDYWIDSNKLQFQVDWLQQHPQDIGCVHKYIVVDEDENIQNIKTFGYYEKEERYTLKDFEEKELPSQLASLVCRNIFRNQGESYPESFNAVDIQGDIKIYLYLLAHGSIYRLPQTYSAYRFVRKVGGNSWSSRNIGARKGYQNWMAYQELEKVFRKEYGIEVSLKKRRAAMAAEVVIDCLYHRKGASWSHAWEVITKQDDCLSMVAKIAINKINRKIKGKID